MAKTVALVGTPNLGRAIIDRLVELGWNAAERGKQRGSA